MALVVRSVIYALLVSDVMGKNENIDNLKTLNLVDHDRCTTIVVGPKAGVTGPMNTQTADCSDCDFRIAKVPARNWPTGSTRPLYQIKNNYPALITPDRGTTWHPDNLEGSSSQLDAWGTESIKTGFIPQVNHTFALFEAGYALMNEHQVAVGESTCPSRFWTSPTTAGGMARIEISEMSKVGLERATTAREAIQIMGDLAVKYGFYAADWSGGDGSHGEGGEALTVVDKTEAWVFHVSGDDTGASAVWVAQRLEPDHVAVVANQFVIRGVEPNSDKFMHSDNMWAVAIRNQLWANGDAPLDFLKTYGLPRAHSPYATRRVWRVFGLVAPSLTLPPNTNMWGDDYPFSVKADSPLSAQDLMRIQRDHYEGTQFDLTKGLAAGPYGDPNRWDVTPVGNLTAYQMIQGSYERAISLFRTSYSFVAQARADVPDSLALLWFAPYAPATSSFTPLYIATETLPVAYTIGSLFKYDSAVAFWNFCAAGNYAGRFYKYAIADIHVLQDQLIEAAISAVQTAEAAVLASSDAKANIALLTQLSVEQGAAIVSSWAKLLPQLITKYHDGYQAQQLDGPDIYMQTMFYPKWWLDATGYWLNKPNLGPGVLLFGANPQTDASGTSSSAVAVAVVVTAIVSSLCTLLIGSYVLRSNKQYLQRHEYVSIDL